MTGRSAISGGENESDVGFERLEAEARFPGLFWEKFVIYIYIYILKRMGDNFHDLLVQ